MARRWNGNADRREDLCLIARCEVCRFVELPRLDLTLAIAAAQSVFRVQQLHDCRHVVAGIAIGDIATDGADIANLRVGNLQRGFAQDRAGVRQIVRVDDTGLGYGCTNGDRVSGNIETGQFVNVLYVDQVLRCRHAQLHHGNEAVATGQYESIACVVGEQSHRLIKIAWPVVVK